MGAIVIALILRHLLQTRPVYRIVLYQLASKKILPILLLCSTYAIGELHHLFSSTNIENWILYRYSPMSEAWNVKYLSEEVNRIIEGVSFLLMFKMRSGAKELYTLTLIEYLVYRITDIFAYFINFKTGSYWYVGVVVGLVMAFFYLNKNKYEKRFNGSVHGDFN